MSRLFDYDVPAPQPARERDKRRPKDAALALPGDAPALIWRHLLDHGADPLTMAALLRDGLGPGEHERAYFELVRAVGASFARDAWAHAFAQGAARARRRAFPVAPREIAEAAIGMPLVGIHVVTGELVDLVTARLGTPAFTLGSEVFISSDGGAGHAVLVHEALHAAQQRGALVAARPGAPSRAAEDDVHRVLRRIGPLEERAGWMTRERARAAMAVRAALGRAPRFAPRPLALAAYEPTHGDAEAVLAEGEKLAAALERQLASGADRAELKAALGPVEDPHAAKVRQVALHRLAHAHEKGARAQLVERLGADAAGYLAPPRPEELRGRPLPDAVRAELEPKLSVPLGDVRVHDHADAHRRAADLDALAFTRGRDIYFAAGHFDPSTVEGKRLLAHELAHVAQQAGAASTPEADGARPNGANGANGAAQSEPGSAVERDADRVADAIASGGHARVQERAAAGTVSRKAAGPAATAHKWVVTLLHQSLDFDPSTAIDALDGTRKLKLPRARVGPISIRDARIKVDSSGGVESGTLYAVVDDGRFRGSQGTLTIDKNGNVAGALEVQIAIPHAFGKTVRLDYAADGLKATVPIAIQDFLAKDLPVTQSNMTLTVSQGGQGLEAELSGSAAVQLDKGFANGAGTMSAAISASGVPAISADIAAALAVPGVNGVADAKMHWDGKNFDLAAAASVDLKIPGVTGTAQLAYKNGKLLVKIPDFAFSWAPLGDRLKFGPFEINDGKLKGAVELTQKITIELPGVSLSVDAGTNLAVDGDALTGLVAGNLKLGGAKNPVFDGDYKLAWHDGQIDGDVTINKALLPWLQVADLDVHVKDLGGANDWSFGGDIDISFREMKMGGKWKLPRFKGGSLLGDFNLDFDFPKIKLPKLDFSLLPDWRIHLPNLPELKLDLDLGALLGKAGEFFGNLPQIDLKLGLGDVDLFHLGDLITSINFTGLKIPLPKLSFAFLEKLDLHLPQLGSGGFDFSKLSGLLKLKLDLAKLNIPGLEIPDFDLGIDMGKLVGKLKLDVDISKVLKFLKGKLSFSFDTSFPDFLHIDGLDITLADPNLAKYAKVAIKWLQGKLSGLIHFEKGELPFKGIKFRIVGGEIKLDDLRPSGWIEVEAAGAKNTATGKLTYDEKGELKLEGKFDMDAASLTNGWLGGALSIGNYGGAATLGGKVNFLKGPMVGKVTDIDALYDLDKNAFSASFKLNGGTFDKIPGMVVTGFDATVGVHVDGAGIKLSGKGGGHVKIGSAIDGDFTAGYDNDGKLAGHAKAPIKIPGVTGTAEATYKDEKLTFKVPDLAFTWKPLGDRLKFGDLQLIDGKLKGAVKLGQSVAIDLPGVKLTIGAGTTLGIDGEELTGVVAGNLKVGGKVPVFDGDFKLAWHAGQIDGELKIIQALLPWLKVQNLEVAMKDIGGANEWSFGQDLDISFREMKFGGKWKLPKFKGGSLLGDFHFDFDFPKLKLPKLDFSLLPDWHISLPKLPDAKIDLDLGALLGKLGDFFGKLPQIDLKLGLKDTDFFNLPGLIDSINFSGLKIPLPKLSFAFLEKLDLHLPGFSASGFDWSKLSGLAKLKLDLAKLKLPGIEIPDLDLGIDAGKLLGKLSVDVDISKVLKFLSGKLRFQFDTSFPDFLHIDGIDLRLADPNLAKYAKAAIHWLQGKLTGLLTFEKGELPFKGIKFRVVGGEIKLDDLKPSGWIEVEAAGAKNKATAKLTYDEKGELKLEGKLDLDAASVTKGWLTGTLSASNYGGDLTLAGKVSFLKGPLVGKVTDIDATYNVDKNDFSAKFHLKNEQLNQIKGVTVTGFDAPIEITKQGENIKLEGQASGHVKVGTYFEGDVTAGYRDGKFFGSITTQKTGLKIKLPAGAKVALEKFKVLIDENLKLQDGDATIGINLYDFVTGDLTLHVRSHALTGFEFVGKVGETKFTKAVPKVALSYVDGAWAGETEVHFKELGGILDDGAAVKVKGGADGFAIEAKDVSFKKGLLKGFKVDEVHYDESTFGGTISGGKDVQVGPVKGSISPGSKVSFDKVAGLGGMVSGELQFGKIATAHFELSGKGESVDIAVKSNIQLAKLSKALEGEVNIAYDSAKKTFTFEALNPGFANEAVKKLAKIDWIKYDGHDFDIKVTVTPGLEFSAGGDRKASVVSGHISWNHGLLEGEVKGKVTGAGANATVTVGWRKGEFFLGAGGEFDLAKYTKSQVTGKVQAEGDTGGGAKFKILEEIKIVKLPQLTITSLEGDLEGESFKVGVKLDAEGKTLGIPLVKVSNLSANAKLAYDHGSISVDGDVKGDATVNWNGKDVVKGHFALNYDGEHFGGKVTVTDVSLSKKLKPEKLSIDYTKLITKVDGAFSFEVPKIITKGTFKPDFDLKANKFDFSSDLHFAPAPLKDVTAHIGMKDGKLDLGVQLTGNKTFKTAGAQLTLGAGTNIAYDQASDSLSGALVGSGKLGKFASGDFSIALADGKLAGTLDMKIGKVPLFKPGTEIAIKYENDQLHTTKDIVLELDSKYTKYVDTKVILSVHNSQIKIQGEITKVKNLGKIGERIHDGKIWYDAETEALGAQGTLDLSSVKFLDDKSKIALSLDTNLNFGAKGHLGFKPVGGGVSLDGALDFEWAPGRFKISGGIKGNINGLAELELRASTSKADPGPSTEMPEDNLQYNLAGKLTAKGLANKFPKLKFSEPPVVSFWVDGGDGGKIDYGMDAFSTRIIQLPGVDKCDIKLDASYAKDKGFNASVAINDLRYKMFKFTGGLSIKESKFEEASIGIESTLKSVNLKGGVKVHAGEMDKLTADAEINVEPTSGTALKWIEEGGVKASFKDGALASASGHITLKKPPLLPLDKTRIEITKEGDDIVGSVDSTFDVPFGKGKKGRLVATFGGEKRWSIFIDAEIKPPGFKSGHITGYADADGGFSVGGSLEADNPKRIREARLEFGYKDGFYLKGGLTLKISDNLDGSVDVEYDQKTDDFLFKGEIKPHQKAPEKKYKQLAGYDLDFPDIPLFSVGVASIVLELGAAFSIGIIEPYVQFNGLKIVGSLNQLKDGNLPEITASARFGMGARAHFELSVAVAGKIDIIIATAKAGIRGKLTADADLNAYTDSSVTFGGNHDGVDISVDATVDGGIQLNAVLEAFLKAKVFGFTIVNETWDLATFPIAEFKLPGWKPFDPFTFNVGGSNPGFKGGYPGVKASEPPGLKDGAKGSSEAAQEESKAEKAKEKTRPVMEGIRDAAHKFEQLPEGWQEGLHAEPVDIESFVGCDEDAWDFYAEKAGDAENWFPELAAKTPAHKMAKAVAIVARKNKKKAGQMILAWQRAQIAHLGINPDSGVNLVQERDEIMQLQQQEFQKEKAAADQKQAIQDVEFAVAVAKQMADWLVAEAAHEKKLEETKRQYEQQVAETKKEGESSHKRLRQAEEHAKHEHVSEAKVKAVAGHHDAPPAPAPPAPVAPPKLEKPEPLKPKPPVPQPLPPEPLPSIVVPHEPQGVEDLLPGGPVPESDMAAPNFKPEKAQQKPAAGTPPDSQAVAESGGAVGKMKSYGETRPTGKMDPSIGKADGKSGQKDTAGPPPAMVEGAGDLAKQGAQLDALLVAAGGKPKNALRSGSIYGVAKAYMEARLAKFKAAHPGAPAPEGMPGASGQAAGGAPAGGAPAHGAPGGAGPGAVDPTVQKVASKGKAAEDKQAADAQTKETNYKHQMADKNQHAGQVEHSLHGEETKAKAQVEKHKMPPAAAFPLPSPEQVRTAYSNWARLKLGGETLASFSEKLAMRKFFNFEQRVWGSILAEYQKVLEQTKLEDPVPEPRDFADKLSSGHTYDSKQFKKASAFDPACRLSDEAIKANDALEKFKQVYRACKPADYLVQEAEKLGDAQRPAFVTTSILPIVESFMPFKALRTALDRLGPSVEVQKQLGLVDAGKLVDAQVFWQRALGGFNASTPGIVQVNDLLHALQEAKKAPDAKDAKAPKTDKPAEDKKEPPRLLHFTDVAARFEALRGASAFEESLGALGVDAHAALAANQAALVARKKQDLARLAKSMAGAKPEQVHAAWLAGEKKRMVEQNRAAADLSLKYAALIAELRAKAPRLDQEGVAKACALFRQRVGSNALVFSIGDVNPANVQPAEKVDPSVAYAKVDGADWNPLLKKDWIEGVYEKLDPSLLAAEAKDPKAQQEHKPDAKPADAKPADAKPADAKPAGVKPAGVKPADAKPADVKPADAKPAGAKPADVKPADAKPADVKPADAKKPADVKPAAPVAKAPEPKPTDAKPGDAGGVKLDDKHDEKKDAKQDEKPKVPKSLEEPAPVTLDKVSGSLASDLVEAKSGAVIYSRGGDTPEHVTEAVLAQHRDAKFDANSGKLTLPKLDEGDLEAATSLAGLGQKVAAETGVSKVTLKGNDKQLGLSLAINPDVDDAAKIPLGKMQQQLLDALKKAANPDVPGKTLGESLFFLKSLYDPAAKLGWRRTAVDREIEKWMNEYIFENKLENMYAFDKKLAAGDDDVIRKITDERAGVLLGQWKGQVNDSDVVVEKAGKKQRIWGVETKRPGVEKGEIFAEDTHAPGTRQKHVDGVVAQKAEIQQLGGEKPISATGMKDLLASRKGGFAGKFQTALGGEIAGIVQKRSKELAKGTEAADRYDGVKFEDNQTYGRIVMPGDRLSAVEQAKVSITHCNTVVDRLKLEVKLEIAKITEVITDDNVVKLADAYRERVRLAIVEAYPVERAQELKEKILDSTKIFDAELNRMRGDVWELWCEKRIKGVLPGSPFFDLPEDKQTKAHRAIADRWRLGKNGDRKNCVLVECKAYVVKHKKDKNNQDVAYADAPDPKSDVVQQMDDYVRVINADPKMKWFNRGKDGPEGPNYFTSIEYLFNEQVVLDAWKPTLKVKFDGKVPWSAKVG